MKSSLNRDKQIFLTSCFWTHFNHLSLLNSQLHLFQYASIQMFTTLLPSVFSHFHYISQIVGQSYFIYLLILQPCLFPPITGTKRQQQQCHKASQIPHPSSVAAWAAQNKQKLWTWSPEPQLLRSYNLFSLTKHNSWQLTECCHDLVTTWTIPPISTGHKSYIFIVLADQKNK